MAINYLQDRKQIRNLVIALIVVFVIVCFASIAQIPQGERITAPFEGKGGEPNTLGGYLLLILSVVGGILLNTDKNDSFKYKALLASMIFFAIIPILFSQSRGTWTAVLPCYLTFLIISKKKAFLGIVLVLTLIIGPFVIPKAIKERFEYTFQKQKGWAAQYQEKSRRCYIRYLNFRKNKQYEKGIRSVCQTSHLWIWNNRMAFFGCTIS